MTSKNVQIKEYLHDYCLMKTPPKYAVMISGQWGSGKTWFVEKLIEEFAPKEIKFLSVSLYGISKSSDIDDELFKQLHPRLSNKGVVLATKVAKGFIKAGLKLDLNVDSELTLSGEIPDIKWPKYLSDADKHILVFDDIERCAIPINELFGYINYFVEHGGHKAILIANQEDIIFKDDADGEEAKIRYQKIKEKLIGKTFEIQADIEEALESFSKELVDSKLLKHVNDYPRIIQKVYELSGTKNLRHLRQSLLEFNRLLETLDKKILAKNELISGLFIEYLVLTFESRSGNLLPEDIKKLSQDLSIAQYSKKPNPHQMNVQKIENKYFELDWRSSLLSDEIWGELFGSGLIDKISINSELMQSKFFASINIPDWRKLWDFYRLEDDEISKLLKSVDKNFRGCKYKNTGELKHVTSTLLELSRLGVYGATSRDILKIALLNVDQLKSSKDWDMDGGEYGPLSDTGWNGLGFHGNNSPKFKDFNNYLNASWKKYVDDRRPTEASELLRILQTDPKEFLHSLVINNSSNSKYYSTPILKFIKPEDFVSAVLNAPISSYKIISICLNERYKVQTLILKDLAPEREWLYKVSKILNSEVKKAKGTIKSVHLSELEKLALAGAKILEPKD